MEQRKEQAKMGYGRVDISDDGVKLVFGTWNNRIIEETGVSDITVSAENDRLRNMSIDSAMPVLISLKDIDPSQLKSFVDLRDDTL